MQSKLRSNRQRLAQCNIDFIDLWSKQPAESEYRKYQRRTMESDSPNMQELSRLSNDLRKIVTQASPSNQSHVVLSYENILGGYDLTCGSKPYPNARAAAQHIVDAFPASDIRIFFSIRSLDRYLESGYIQRVFTRRETRDIEQYVAEIDLEILSWVPAVRSLEAVIGAENLSVWEYEKFFTGEASIWRELLNDADPDSLLVKPAKSRNLSQSAKGLKYMLNVNRFATPGDCRRFRRFVKSTFAPSKGKPSPRLLDDALRERLIERYEHDCDDLGDLLARNSATAAPAEA